MRLHPLRPMLLCLALLVASGHAMANESRQAAADDACPDTATASTAERTDDTPVDEPTAPVRQTHKAKPAVSASPRTTGGTRTNPPRFHSFLPGMFR
jgi:hypothetical protein